jgi:hypothetical protein
MRCVQMRSDQAYPEPAQAGNGGEYRRRYKALSDKRRLCLCLCLCLSTITITIPARQTHHTYTPSAAYARPPCTTPLVQPLPPLLLFFPLVLQPPSYHGCQQSPGEPCSPPSAISPGIARISIIPIPTPSFPRSARFSSRFRCRFNAFILRLLVVSDNVPLPITTCTLRPFYRGKTSMASQTLYKTTLKTETRNQQEPRYTCVFVAHALAPIRLDANPVSERLPHADVDRQATPESQYNQSQAAAS